MIKKNSIFGNIKQYSIWILLRFELISIPALLFVFMVADFICKDAPDVGKIVKAASAILWGFTFIIVFFIYYKKDYKERWNDRFKYKGNKTLEILDDRINKCKKTGSIREMCGLINKVYIENDYSLEEMLERQHIIDNNLRIGGITRELVLAGTTALLFPVIQEMIKEDVDVPIIMSFILHVLVLFFFVTSVSIDYFKPTLKMNLVLYEYENKILSERIERAQRKAWNDEKDEEYCEE